MKRQDSLLPDPAGPAAEEEHAAALRYIRDKTNQLLRVMGTVSLRPEELDDRTLLELDPIGIVADSFSQVLAHLNETNAGLRSAKEEIDAIFRAVGVGIMVVDAEGRILECNERQRERFFAGPTSALGRFCCQAVCGEEQLPANCALRRALRTGGPVHVFDWPHRDRHFDIVATPIVDADRCVGRVVLVYTDVTDRIAAARALQESEERYRDLFENASDLIQSVAPDGTLVYVNRAWREALGYTEEEVAGLRIFDVVDPGCLDACSLAFQRVMSGESLRGIEVRFRTKRGSTLLLEGNASCSFENGRPVATRGIFRDVTDKRRMEENLLNAQKLESVGLLAGGIAHDFNNLLTGVLANVSSVLHRLDPACEERHRLAEAEKAALRARDLTQQLLTFSRGGEPVRRAFSAEAVVRESAALALAGSRSRLQFDASPDLWPVDGDEGQVAQVLRNLLVNADQAMPAGGTVTVRCENVALEPPTTAPLAPGRYVAFTVEDQGTGIAPENLGRIFEPYFTTRRGGTGLGLAVAYSVVGKHRGTLEVASRPGEGAVFRVLLPAAESAEAAGEPEAPRGPQAGGAAKVLVMDDEEFIRELTTDLLSELGYQVAAVRDGRDALEAYRREQEAGAPFQVVIMDLTVPGGMGGKEAIQRLRALDPEVRAIVSSGYSHDPVMANFREHGFSGVVAKPYTLSALERVLREVLASRD